MSIDGQIIASLDESVCSQKELRDYGEKGLFPYPFEPLIDFVKRARSFDQGDCQNDRKKTTKNHQIYCKDWYKQLGCRPSWVQISFSNKKLPFWQGGALWVSDYHKKHQPPVVQLRQDFFKGAYFKYTKKEVLLHEITHALRFAFDESRFEEILAYYHSPSKFRRFFGPLFKDPKQSNIFLSLLFCSFILQITAPFWVLSPLYSLFNVGILLPVIDLIQKGCILVRDQRIFRKTLKKIALLFPKSNGGFPILLRLKDEEICQFALLSLEELGAITKDKSHLSPRWLQIFSQFC